MAGSTRQRRTGPKVSAVDLRSSSLFAGLAKPVLDELARSCGRRSLERGDVLWTVGDPADAVVVVLSGELEVWAAGPRHRLARIGPGGHVGEMGALLDEPRSATVSCARPAEVLTVPTVSFREVMTEDPAAAAHLTEVLTRRAMASARGERPTAPPVVAGVVAQGQTRGARLVAGVVAALGGELAPTSVLNVLPVDEAHTEDDDALDGVGQLSVRCDPSSPASLRAQVERILLASPAPRLLLVVFPADRLDLAAALCDTVVVLTETRDEPISIDSPAVRVLRVVNPHPRRAPVPGPINHSEPFVLRHEPALRDLPVAEAVRQVLAQPRLPSARTLGRLTRKLLGVSVGVALGGGAAFGIAHVGILQALEAAGLPVDVVAGTSMGSIIAIGHASGLSGDEMAEIADRIGNVRTTLSALDPTLGGAGLLSGRRLVSIFSPLIPISTFDELVEPCRVVAMDVETGEQVDIGTGPLDMAFRASCSIPLVFTPVKVDGRTLVDGAMINPVPVDVARQMGADIVVGLNVVPKLEPEVTSSISRVFKQANRFNPLARLGGLRDLPDLVDVLMSSLQVVQHELGTFKQLTADVAVDVPLARFTWIDFYRAGEIVAQGREAGAVAVDGLRAEMARRLEA